MTTRIDMNEARSLCTQGELKIVRAASPSELSQQSAAELKKHVTQARRLRDKWRDQATRQRRQTQQQQAARTTDKNARSREKQELFSAVLERLEAQLSQVNASAGASAGGKKSASQKNPKSQRAKSHRTTRSQVRERLGAKQEKLNTEREAPAATKKKTTKKKTAKKKTAKKKVTQKSAKKKTAKKKSSAGSTSSASAASKPPSKKTARKKTGKKKTAGAASGGSGANSGVMSALAQMAGRKPAKTAAKQARVKASGLKTRVRGHVSARGKRAQGRRDARG